MTQTVRAEQIRAGGRAHASNKALSRGYGRWSTLRGSPAVAMVCHDLRHNSAPTSIAVTRSAVT
jgi:hypothetical protein